MVRRAWQGALLASLLGCSAEKEPRTELMLVADTDLAEATSITFLVDGPDDRHEETSGTVVAGEPRTLALVHTKGALGPFVVSAVALNGAKEPLLTRTHEVSFVKGQTLVVPLHLAARCLDSEPCGDEQACTESGCAPRKLEELARWSGEPESVFDGTPDMDGAAPDDDAGPNGDGDGDGTGDGDGGGDGDGSLLDGGPDAGPPDAGSSLRVCGDAGVVDTSNTLEHCGVCFNECPLLGSLPLNALGPACIDGMCDLECSGTWRNCSAAPGCETDVSDDERNCGACGNDCGAGEKCLDSVCQ